MSFVSTPVQRSITNILLLAAIAATYFSLAVSAFEISLNIPTDHHDGAYQTASGLYRLAEGQLPGKDFFPYLGVGPLLLLYPLFVLAGSHVAASVFSSHLVAGVALTLIAGQIHYLVTQRKSSPLVSLGFGCVYYIAAAPFILGLPWMDETFVRWGSTPGNSLRPLRALLPFIAAFVVIVVAHLKLSPQRRSMVLAAFAGVCLIWSNDYAYVTAAGLLTIIVLPALGRSWKEAGMAIAAFAVSAASTYYAATAGHPLPLLRYNFVDVAGDQWWYFASWNETHRIFSLTDLGRLVTPQWILPIAATMSLGRRYRKHKEFKDGLLLWVGAILFAGGAIASIGGHIDRYFDPVCQWGALVLIAMVFESLRDRIANSGPAYPKNVINLGIAAVAAAFGLSAFHSSLVSIHLEQKSLASASDDRIYVRELGGYLPSIWRDYIYQARQPSTAVVIEEYWGIYSAIRRAFPPWPVDSVIHALGSVRKIAEGSLDSQGALIISSRYASSSDWQPWNLSTNYWFYRPLLANGVVRNLSPATVMFTLDDARLFTPVPCTLGPSGDRFKLHTATPGYYEVLLSFSVTGSGRFLLMVENRMVFAAGSAGNFSLDYRKGSALFPVYLDDPAYPDFPMELRPSTTKRQMLLHGCEARKITFEHKAVLQVPAAFTKAFFHTGKDWDRGFSKKHTAFYLPNLARTREMLHGQREVLLPSGERRTITQVKAEGNLVFIYLDGPRLDPAQIGFPDNLTFLP